MIQLLIVSDSRLFRESLACVLDSHEGVKAVDTAADAGEMTTALLRGQTDIALIDAASTASTSLVRTASAAGSNSKIVVLGLEESEQAVLDVIEAGASGYVARDASARELTLTIEGVTRGEFLCPPTIAGCLLRRVATLARATGTARGLSLTRREREIANLLEHGLTNKQIAAALSVQVSTVKNHVHHLLEKLGACSRAEAVDLLHGRTRQDATGLSLHMSSTPPSFRVVRAQLEGEERPLAFS